MVKVSGIAQQSRTATVLLRGSNKLVLEEAERRQELLPKYLPYTTQLEINCS